MGLRFFPVAASGRPKYSDDYLAPRGPARAHGGIDIFATQGTPIFAVQDGLVRTGLEPLGGIVLYLQGADGRTYFYAHLERAEGVLPRAVKAGDVIGYVGSTGNAAGTPPHLHFQITQADGLVTNPFPELLGFLPVDRRSSSRRSSSSSLHLNSSTGFAVVVLILLALASKKL